MLHEKRRTLTILAIPIIILGIITSAGGLLISNLYRDNAFVRSTWLGNDLITLFLAVPILVIALIFTYKGSQTAYLVTLGMFDYMLYNYAFYLFGTAFNAFFLLYVALLVLSIFALIFGLINLDPNTIYKQFAIKTPVLSFPIQARIYNPKY